MTVVNNHVKVCQHSPGRATQSSVFLSHCRFRLPKTHREHRADSPLDTQTSAVRVHQHSSCIYTNITHFNCE